MLCPKCNQEIPDGAKFCPNCGTAIEQPKSTSSSIPEPQKQSSWKWKYTLVAIIIIAGISLAEYKWYRVYTIRSKVEQVKADMQMLATGLESYYIDASVYPSPGRPSFREPGSYSGDGSYAQDGGILPVILTTPIAYMKNIPHDPFRNNGKGYYGYGGGPGVKGTSGRATIDDPNFDFSGVWYASGWIVSSYGPDKVDGNSSVPGGTQLREELCWTDSHRFGIDSESLMQCDSTHPLSTSGLTYDPTNGIISPGDLWRRGPYETQE